MATLEDKILGDKLHNYCSSSEDDSEDESDDNQEKKNTNKCDEPNAEIDVNKWEGTSTNTGPKGVIKDWQRFKQLEIEKREDNEKERVELMKKLTLTVKTALDAEKEKAKEDAELDELLNDEFLLEYQKKRMQEMLKNQPNIVFGKLLYLKNGEEYLDAIDKENKQVKIIIHLYEDHVESCRAMNACLTNLAKIYKNVKFCSIIASRAGLSRDFKINGLPALLIYKSGQLVGNFVRLTDDIGNDFCAEDVQTFLVEHGMLEDKSCKPVLIRNGDCNDSD